MSHKRSGLLPGLIIGLIAMLLGMAGVGAGILFAPLLPSIVYTFAHGIPYVVALSIVAGLLVGRAMTLVRPRARTLIPLAALYGAGASALGLIGGSAVQEASLPAAAFPAGARAASYPGLTLDTFMEALPRAIAIFLAPVELSWPLWTSVAVSALLPLTLVARRVRRLRRADASVPARPPARKEPEPEYRAPFEPLQAAKPATAPPNLFSPPDRGEA